MTQNVINFGVPKRRIKIQLKRLIYRRHTSLTGFSAYNQYSRELSIRCICGFILLIGLMMITGILIVYFKWAKPIELKCEFQLYPTVPYSSHDSSHPHSIAVGDFNRDHHMDIVVANSGFDTVGIFLGYGNNSFTTQRTYSMGIGSAPRAVAIGDFNNDNLLDIVVANSGINNIKILFGNGDGKFFNPITIGTSPSQPIYVVVDDFNNDHYSDIAFLGYGTNIIGIILGAGNDTFRSALEFFTGYDSLPYSIAVADLNNDGRKDIAITNYGTHNIVLFLGYENKDFTSQMTLTTGINSGPNSIAIFDLNNDNLRDMAVVYSDAGKIAIFFGYGNGSFGQSQLYSVGRNSKPAFIAIADFNNDNKSDITVVNKESNNLILLFGYGNGTFTNPITYSTGRHSSPCSIGIGDFNNDNQLDVAITNYENNNIKIFNSENNKKLAKPKTFVTGDTSSFIGVFFISTQHTFTPCSLAIGDFNGDNQSDIVVANYGGDSVGVSLGNGDGTFSDQTIYFTGADSTPISVDVGDFNNDDILDIVVANHGAHGIGIFFGHSNGEFSVQKILSMDADLTPYAITISDFNKDGKLDIAVANERTDTFGIFLGYGNGEFSNQTTYSTGLQSTPVSIVTADWNNDTQEDIAVVNIGTSDIVIFLGYGNGSFRNSSVLSISDGSSPLGITVGDFSNDGQLDIAIAYLRTSNVGVFLGHGNGEFSLHMVYFIDVDSKPFSIVTNDFNNDGQLDIAVCNYGTSNIAIFLGVGDGSFSFHKTYSTGVASQPYAIRVANFNNDDRLDIAVANSGRHDVVVLLGQDIEILPTVTYPSAISACLQLSAVGDFNSDGNLDIAIANVDTNNISILLGYGNGIFGNPFVMSTGDDSFLTAIAVGDFNNDGRLDIAVTNCRMNNVGIFLGHGNGEFEPDMSYETNSFCPMSLAVGDANHDGHLDIFVATGESMNVGVLFGNGNGQFSLHTIYDNDADSWPFVIILADFNNDSRLDIAVVNFIKNNVGILLGWGNGTFQRQRILSTGTSSLPKSLAADDFNNDGNIDIAVGITQYFEEGILILFGNGNGEFPNYKRYTTQITSIVCSVVITDFNNDSELDIAMISIVTKELGIFLGYGDGTFSSEIYYPTGTNSNPISIATGDFNNDNLTDLAVANHGMPFVSIFLGFIDTNFVDRSTYFTGAAAFPTSMVLGDFTNDGQLDIVVGNDGTHDIVTLMNSGEAKFSMQIAYSANSIFYPTSIVASDFNDDKKLDIAVANSFMNTLTVFHGEGNGTFRKYKTFETEPDSSPQSLSIGDFNNDNNTDVVVAHSATGAISLFLKIETGALERFRTLSVGTHSKPRVLTTADFDNDNFLDIVVTNNGGANIGFFFGLGDGTFAKQKVISLGNSIFPTWVGLGDFNNDKKIDIVVSNSAPSTSMNVLINNGNRTFRIEKINDVDSTYMGAVDDLNNDGYLDVVLCYAEQESIAVLLGYGNGTFKYPMVYSISSSSYSIIINDFNDDNRLDIVIIHSGEFNIVIMFGLGNGTFSNTITYSTVGYGRPNSIAAADFNDDGWIDIALGMNGQKSIGIFFGQGNGTFSSYTPYRTRSVSFHQSIDVGDFNNDGRLDIIITETNHGRIAVFLGHVNGTFFNEITYSTGNNSYPYSLALADFNKDGRLDVAVSNMLTDDISIFLGYANEDFVSASVESIGNSSEPVSITAGDFDNDTCLDVVVADRRNNNIVIIRGSGYGTFLDQKIYSTGNDSLPSWVAIDDFNCDQYSDIAVVNSGTNNIGIFLGHGNGTFSNLIISSTDKLSSPVSLSVGHFDNNTNVDIAVASFDNNRVCILFGYGNGSFGNAECRTSGYDSRPSMVISGDINGDRISDIVIANKGSSTIEILAKIC